MNVEEFAKKFGYDTICMPDPDRIIDGGYAGDLLSWVMGRAEENQAWITIMTNINILAVASLSGVSAVIVAEGAEISAEIVAKATEQGINVLRSSRSSFEVAVALGRALEQ